VFVAMEEPSQLKRAIIDSSAGAISGGISRTVTSPLDVIKIRFQVFYFFNILVSLLFIVSLIIIVV
jgi:hypothetical protein